MTDAQFDKIKKLLPHLTLGEIDSNFDIDLYEPEVLVLAYDLEVHPDNIKGDAPNLSHKGKNYLVMTEADLDDMAIKTIKEQMKEWIDDLPTWLSVHIDIDHIAQEATETAAFTEIFPNLEWETSVNIDGTDYEIYSKKS